MLQDHGRADSWQGPDLEEDPQAAANLLQIQKLSERLSFGNNVDFQIFHSLCSSAVQVAKFSYTFVLNSNVLKKRLGLQHMQVFTKL